MVSRRNESQTTVYEKLASPRHRENKSNEADDATALISISITTFQPVFLFSLVLPSNYNLPRDLHPARVCTSTSASTGRTFLLLWQFLLVQVPRQLCTLFPLLTCINGGCMQMKPRSGAFRVLAAEQKKTPVAFWRGVGSISKTVA